MWLRAGSVERLLEKRSEIHVHRNQGICRPTVQLSVFQDVLCLLKSANCLNRRE